MTAPPLCTHSLALLYITCPAAPTMFWGICWHSCKSQFCSCCTVAGIRLYTLDFRTKARNRRVWEMGSWEATPLLFLENVEKLKMLNCNVVRVCAFEQFMSNGLLMYKMSNWAGDNTRPSRETIMILYLMVTEIFKFYPFLSGTRCIRC